MIGDAQPPAERSDQAPRSFATRAALAKGIAQLTAAHVPSATLTAEMLLLHVLQRDRSWFYAHPEGELSAEQSAEYARLLAARADGAPTQYLTGHQEFWGLDFEVTPEVLIPRPETEHMIEVALERLGARRTEPLAIADIGTGSGCIAVTLAHEFPHARILATDVSTAALEVARRNAARHSASDRIDFREADLLDLRSFADIADVAASPVAQVLPPHSGGEPEPFPRFDLIVSNPPYVARNEAAALQREVRDHEPELALYGGATGVEIYTRLVRQAPAALRPGGTLILELGYDSADHVRSLLEAEPGWTDISLTKDLAGIPRVIAAIRRFTPMLK